MISSTSQSLDGLDTLPDSGDELLLIDLLSRGRPVTSRVIPQVIPQVIDLMIDSLMMLHKLLDIIKRQQCSLVSLMPTLFLSLQTSPADDLLIPGAYPQSTILRRQHLREYPLSRIAHLGQFASPR